MGDLTLPMPLYTSHESRFTSHALQQCAPSVRAHELLHAPAVARLSRVDVALRIDGEDVERAELARVTAVAAEAAQQLPVFAGQDMDLAALTVGKVQVLLRRVRREEQVPGVQRACPRPQYLGYERAVLAEDLHAVVAAVADVDETVVGDPYAVHRIGELLRRRRGRVVRGHFLVARHAAVRAPVPLVGAGR